MKSEVVKPKNILDIVSNKPTKQCKNGDFAKVIDDVKNSNQPVKEEKINKKENNSISILKNDSSKKIEEEKSNNSVETSESKSVDVKDNVEDVNKKIAKLMDKQGKISKDEAKKEIKEIVDDLKKVVQKDGDADELDFVAVLDILDQLSSLLKDFKIDLTKDKEFSKEFTVQINDLAKLFLENIENSDKESQIKIALLSPLIEQNDEVSINIGNEIVKKDNRALNSVEEKSVDLSMEKILKQHLGKVVEIMGDLKKSLNGYKAKTDITKDLINKIDSFIKSANKIIDGVAKQKDVALVTTYIKESSLFYSTIKDNNSNSKKTINSELKKVLENIDISGNNKPIKVSVKSESENGKSSDKQQNQGANKFLENLQNINKHGVKSGIKFEYSKSMENVIKNSNEVSVTKNEKEIVKNDIESTVLNSVKNNQSSLANIGKSETLQKNSLRDRILNQIENKIKLNAKNIVQGKLVKIELEPEHLGKVSVKIDMHSSSEMTAKIKVDNAQVLNLVKDNIAKLKQVITDMGIKDIDVQVDINQEKGEQQSQMEREEIYKSKKEYINSHRKVEDEDVVINNKNNRVYKDSIYEILA